MTIRDGPHRGTMGASRAANRIEPPDICKVVDGPEGEPPVHPGESRMAGMNDAGWSVCIDGARPFDTSSAPMDLIRSWRDVFERDRVTEGARPRPRTRLTSWL